MNTVSSGVAAMVASPTGNARLRGVTLSDGVADTLRRSTVDGAIVRLPEGKLEPDLYRQVDKVLKALGGKWDRRARGHIFAKPIGDELAAALHSGLAVDRKKTLEQFFTPTELAERMVRLAGVHMGSHVLEPSAGSGNLIRPAIASGAVVTAVEIDPTLCASLAALDGAHGSVFAFNADFTGWQPSSLIPIDVVLMNPPFSAGKDVAHVQHAWSLLRDGGELVAIVGPHAFISEDRRSVAFRAFLEEIDASCEVLPAGTFKESGTMVGAQLIVATKK